MLQKIMPLTTEQLMAFCSRWKIIELSVFGSVLRSDFSAVSDVDILVTFAPDAGWSLFDLAEMQQELEAIVGRKVDLVERRAVEQSMNYIRRNAILNSAEVVYVA